MFNLRIALDFMFGVSFLKFVSWVLSVEISSYGFNTKIQQFASVTIVLVSEASLISSLFTSLNPLQPR